LEILLKSDLHVSFETNSLKTIIRENHVPEYQITSFKLKQWLGLLLPLPELKLNWGQFHKKLNTGV
jgi:hypothetical protein